MNDDFLNSVNEISEYQSEYSILVDFYKLFPKFYFLLELSSLEIIKDNFSVIVEFIKKEYKSFDLRLFHINEKIEMKSIVLTKKAGMSLQDVECMNYAINISKENKSFVLVKHESFVLMNSGIFDNKFKNKFADMIKIQKAENQRLTIDQLELAFGQYHLERKHNGCEYVKNGKISNKVDEQYLRNDLIEYLNLKMKPYISDELCTSLENDEESVDIGVIDADNKVAIIEIKFFVKKGFFEDSDKIAYSFVRFLHGYQQLNRYCIHLNEYKYKIHSAYLYMFYAHDENETAIRKQAKNYYEKYVRCNNYSDEFIQNYKDTIIDNMLDA